MEALLATYKQLEHALRYLGAIAEQTSEGVAVLDPAGVVQFVNPAWVIMHGRQTTNDFLGRPISAFLAEEQKKADVSAFIEQAKSPPSRGSGTVPDPPLEGRKIGLVEHLKSDGTTFLAQMTMTAVKDDAGRVTGLVVFATDVTQRRRLEEILRGNTRKAVQLAEGIAQLQTLFVEARSVEESLMKQAAGLDADSQELQRQLAGWAQAHEVRSESDKSDGPDLSDKSDRKSREGCLAAGRAAPEARRPQGSLRQYPLNAEELRKVAELGRRLAGPNR